MPMNTITSFIGSSKGAWTVLSNTAVTGSPLGAVKKLNIIPADNKTIDISNTGWILKGFKSNLRYTTRDEKNILDKTPSVLGKPENNFAALIPIKKSDEWWLLPQDERRKILQEKSHHIEIGSRYLSTISRSLYHSRDIGEEFDFLTWFEYPESQFGRFDELVQLLRKTEEWKYVVREIDIRLKK
jgi:chlorite dismutase